MKAKILGAALFGALVSQAATAADINLALDAAQDLRERARFPEWSAPVAPGDVDPVVSSRLPTKQSQAGTQGAAPTLTVWASTISALPGQSVDLYAQLTDERRDANTLSELIAARTLAASSITAQLTREVGGALGQVTYRDNGQGADAKAGDGIYSARYVLPTTGAPALGKADSVMVVVSALLPDGQTRNAAGGFQFSNPAARLTGNFRDSLVNGSLVLAAEMSVLAPGRVHLSGTVTDLAGTPVVSAQTAKVVATGKQWVNLTFYGLAISDRLLSGPLRLGSVTLTSTNGMPNALGPVLGNPHLTLPYLASQFTKLPFNNPDLLEAARRLEASALPATGLGQ